MAAGDGRFQNATFRLGVLRGRHALRGRSRVRDSRTGSFLLDRKSVFSRAGDDAGSPDSVYRGLSDGNGEPARAHRADPSADEEHDHFSPEPNVPLSPTRERDDAGLLAGDSAPPIGAGPAAGFLEENDLPDLDSAVERLRNVVEREARAGDSREPFRLDPRP